jgi:hypothetical protein
MKNYLLRFGQNNPANYTGLSPTFTVFAFLPSGTLTTPPGITESPAGTGLYSFGWTATTLPVAFKCDGGATLSSTDRFIVGILDPVDAVDEKIGWLTDSFGTTATDPTTLLGYARRNQEVEEGDADYLKASGVWSVSSRGASVLLFEKTLVNNSGSVTKA